MQREPHTQLARRHNDHIHMHMMLRRQTNLKFASSLALLSIVALQVLWQWCHQRPRVPPCLDAHTPLLLQVECNVCTEPHAVIRNPAVTPKHAAVQAGGLDHGVVDRRVLQTSVRQLRLVPATVVVADGVGVQERLHVWPSHEYRHPCGGGEHRPQRRQVEVAPVPVHAVLPKRIRAVDDGDDTAVTQLCAHRRDGQHVMPAQGVPIKQDAHACCHGSSVVLEVLIHSTCDGRVPLAPRGLCLSGAPVARYADPLDLNTKHFAHEPPQRVRVVREVVAAVCSDAVVRRRPLHVQYKEHITGRPRDGRSQHHTQPILEGPHQVRVAGVRCDATAHLRGRLVLAAVEGSESVEHRILLCPHGPRSSGVKRDGHGLRAR
eukprot:PhM_4_TR5316/c0_g1_i1/m.81891